MYVCVLTVVAGQALLFGRALLFAYAGLLLAAFHLFVRFHEEPQLRRRFGGSHEANCLHMRRWWPRLTPWRGSGTQAALTSAMPGRRVNVAYQCSDLPDVGLVVEYKNHKSGGG